MVGGGQGARLGALDGMRALAVLAVMLHHAQVSWAPGGFLGVDTFFVLSGFLITTLLADERARSGRIDLAAFWTRRARRLLPALLVVVGVVCAGTIGNDAVARSLRVDAAAAIGYVANWRFLASESDYFGATGDPSPLQHTWSLGIEEQFYLLIPLAAFVVAAWRWRRWQVLLVAAAGAVASALLMAALFDPADPSRAYYGTDTRLQNLLVGVALAMVLARARPRRGVLYPLALAGAVGTGLLWVNAEGGSESLYQGGFLLAGVSTAAVIAAVVLVPDGVLSRSLGVWPLRALGRISYGVYLWHWPMQLAITNRYTGWSGPQLIVSRMILTVAVATVSFFLIEEPIRRRRVVRPAFTLTGFATAAALTAAVVAAVLVPPAEPDLELVRTEAATEPTAPKPPTVPTTAPAVTALGPKVEPPTSTAPATAPPETVETAPPDTAPPPPPAVGITVSVLGDSVAQSLARGSARPGDDYSVTVYDDAILGCGVARSGSYTLNGETSGLADECAAWDDIWRSRVASHRPDVAAILVGRHEVVDRIHNGQWTNILDPAYADYVASELANAVAAAGASGARVVFLTAPYYSRREAPDGTPYPENDPARIETFNSLLRSVAGATGTPVIDLGGYTSPGGSYARTVDGVRVRSDGVHYSAEGCAWMAPWLMPQLRSLVGV